MLPVVLARHQSLYCLRWAKTEMARVRTWFVLAGLLLAAACLTASAAGATSLEVASGRRLLQAGAAADATKPAAAGPVEAKKQQPAAAKKEAPAKKPAAAQEPARPVGAANATVTAKPEAIGTHHRHEHAEHETEEPARVFQSQGVEPRYSIAEISDMSDTDPYKLIMIAAWTEMTTSEERRSVYSYWRLAGIHGKHWPYNNVDAPAEGFCKHRQPAFGPWHRSYMKMYENALIQAAESAADSISNNAVKRVARAAAAKVRLPYWDWTKPEIPALLTRPEVACYQTDGSIGTCRNPFSGYEYVAPAGRGRDAGLITRRASNWQGAMRGSASTFGRQMASFVRSSNWRCTYTGAANCFGNLEQVHNDVHNIMGGTGGDMATIEFAGFDPVFWLHHCMLDRALWLFQNNGGGWQGLRASYSPFQNIPGDLTSIQSLGYTYTTGADDARGDEDVPSGPGSGGGRRRRFVEEEDDEDGPRRPPPRGRRPRARRAELEDLMEDDEEPVALQGVVATAAARPMGEGVRTPVGSPAAKAAVRAALAAWSGNYTGFEWAVRFQELNEHQLDKVAHIYVFLDTLAAREAAGHVALPSKVAEYNDLRVLPNFCGSASGFNDYNLHVMHAQQAGGPVATAQNRAVDLTECLQRAGIATDVPAAVPGDRARGPSHAAIRVADLKIVAINSDGEDVSSQFDFGKPVISWSLPVQRTLGQVKSARAASEPGLVSLMSMPKGFAAEDEVFSVVGGNFV